MRPKFIITADVTSSGEHRNVYISGSETLPNQERIDRLADAVTEIAKSDLGTRLIPEGETNISIKRRPKTYFGNYVEVDTLPVDINSEVADTL